MDLAPALPVGQLVACETTSRAGLQAVLGTRLPKRVAGGVACALAAPLDVGDGVLTNGTTLVVLTKKGEPFCTVVTFESTVGGQTLVSSTCPTP